jgi:hypothetical protein
MFNVLVFPPEQFGRDLRRTVAPFSCTTPTCYLLRADAGKFIGWSGISYRDLVDRDRLDRTIA